MRYHEIHQSLLRELCIRELGSCVSGGLHPSLATSIQRVVVRIREAHGRQRSWRGWKVGPAGQCSGSFEVHVITCFKEHLFASALPFCRAFNLPRTKSRCHLHGAL